MASKAMIQTGRVAAVTRATAPHPPPEVDVTARADADRARDWWAKWNRLAPVERRRPAAEVLADTRESDDA